MNPTKVFSPLLIFILTTSLTATAQTNFEPPQKIELKTKDDYAKYETTIVEAAKWLEATDLDKEADKRKQVNTFVLEWVSGSPTINIDITEQLAKIYGKNVQFIAIYMSSYSADFIENKTSATKFTATKAGLISMMNVYKKGIDISRSKEMEKLIKLTSENKLDEYIHDNFKV
jgi:hypothetical protein